MAVGQPDREGDTEVVRKEYPIPRRRRPISVAPQFPRPVNGKDLSAGRRVLDPLVKRAAQAHTDLYHTLGTSLAVESKKRREFTFVLIGLARTVRIVVDLRRNHRLCLNSPGSPW